MPFYGTPKMRQLHPSENGTTESLGFLLDQLERAIGDKSRRWGFGACRERRWRSDSYSSCPLKGSLFMIMMYCSTTSIALSLFGLFHAIPIICLFPTYSRHSHHSQRHHIRNSKSGRLAVFRLDLWSDIVLSLLLARYAVKQRRKSTNMPGTIGFRSRAPSVMHDGFGWRMIGQTFHLPFLAVGTRKRY